jgi:cytochrome c-type biogenesis protein CcmF
VLEVRRGGRDLGTLQAGKNAYTIENQLSNEVGIRSDPLTGEDLFVIAEQINPDGSVNFRVFVKPLVNLIWLAGLVFLVGSVITLWPDRREQRRLVRRASEVGLPASA